MKKNILLLASVSVLLLSGALFVSANHSWGGYHWAKTTEVLSLKLGDNVSGDWDNYLSIASSDWSQSSVLDTTIVAGAGTGCLPVKGRIEVCNGSYGENGWMGIAQIWIRNGHIIQGTTKVNDTYLNMPAYNNAGFKSLVMCQEIGHNFGLDHQDEDFYNAPIDPHTCMDYFVPSASEVVHPNQHDYDQLALIYGHTDTTTKPGKGNGRGNNVDVQLGNPSDWGKAVSQDAQNRDNKFEKDLGNGMKVLTHVFWVQ